MKGKLKARCSSSSPVAVVGGQGLDLHRRLPDEQPGRVVGVAQRPPAPEDFVDLGSVPVVDGSLPEELHVEVVVLGGGRVVPQLGVFDDDVADVDPESGHPPVEPERA